MKTMLTPFAAILIVLVGFGIGAFYAGIITTYAVNAALGTVCYWISGKVTNLFYRVLLLIMAVMAVCTSIAILASCLINDHP